MGITLRAQVDNPVGQGFFDLGFFVSSSFLAIGFGAALVMSSGEFRSGRMAISLSRSAPISG
jgi:hypothetical protein